MPEETRAEEGDSTAHRSVAANFEETKRRMDTGIYEQVRGRSAVRNSLQRTRRERNKD